MSVTSLHRPDKKQVVRPSFLLVRARYREQRNKENPDSLFPGGEQFISHSQFDFYEAGYHSVAQILYNRLQHMFNKQVRIIRHHMTSKLRAHETDLALHVLTFATQLAC